MGNENIHLFFSRYDTNRDGKISLAEFNAALTPKVGVEYASLVQGRAEFYSKRGFDPREYFNIETRRQLRHLWQAILFTERQIENLRNRVVSGPIFSLQSAFRYIDKEGRGVVTSVELREFLSDHGFFATEKELALLVNKFDKRGAR